MTTAVAPMPVRGPAASTVVSSKLKPVRSFWKWQDDAACKDINVNVFFLDNNVRGDTKKNSENFAKSICARCPVINACRNHALTVPETYGVWGGLSADERDVILRAQGFKPEYTRLA